MQKYTAFPRALALAIGEEKQMSVAARADISQQSVCGYLSGKNIPGHHKISRIIAALPDSGPSLLTAWLSDIIGVEKLRAVLAAQVQSNRTDKAPA